MKWIELLHNKMKFYDLCTKLSIKTPYTEIAKYPVENKIYKRIFSRCGESATLNIRDVDFRSGEWIAQDFIKGVPISSFSVGENTLVYRAKFYSRLEPFSNIYIIARPSVASSQESGVRSQNKALDTTDANGFGEKFAIKQTC